MKVSGVEVRKISDVQDVLSELSTIYAKLEILSENFSDFETINSSFSSNIEAQKNIVNAVNAMQKNIQEMTRNFECEKDKIKQNNKRLVDSLNSTLSTSINEIDVDFFTSKVENLLKLKISNLNKEAMKISHVTSSLNEATNNFNKSSKILNMKLFAAAFFGGIFFGAILMLFLGLNHAKDYYFSAEKQTINELESRYKNASDLEKLGRKFDIITSQKNSKKTFIAVKKNEVKSAYNSTNYFIIELK